MKKSRKTLRFLIIELGSFNAALQEHTGDRS